eukprot:748002-Hanusia_phi.AAC.3
MLVWVKMGSRQGGFVGGSKGGAGSAREAKRRGENQVHEGENARRCSAGVKHRRYTPEHPSSAMSSFILRSRVLKSLRDVSHALKFRASSSSGLPSGLSRASKQLGLQPYTSSSSSSWGKATGARWLVVGSGAAAGLASFLLEANKSYSAEMEDAPGASVAALSEVLGKSDASKLQDVLEAMVGRVSLNDVDDRRVLLQLLSRKDLLLHQNDGIRSRALKALRECIMTLTDESSSANMLAVQSEAYKNLLACATDTLNRMKESRGSAETAETLHLVMGCLSEWNLKSKLGQEDAKGILKICKNDEVLAKGSCRSDCNNSACDAWYLIVLLTRCASCSGKLRHNRPLLPSARRHLDISQSESFGIADFCSVDRVQGILVELKHLEVPRFANLEYCHGGLRPSVGFSEVVKRIALVSSIEMDADLRVHCLVRYVSCAQTHSMTCCKESLAKIASSGLQKNLSQQAAESLIGAFTFVLMPSRVLGDSSERPQVDLHRRQVLAPLLQLPVDSPADPRRLITSSQSPAHRSTCPTLWLLYTSAQHSLLLRVLTPGCQILSTIAKSSLEAAEFLSHSGAIQGLVNAAEHHKSTVEIRMDSLPLTRSDCWSGEAVATCLDAIASADSDDCKTHVAHFATRDCLTRAWHYSPIILALARTSDENMQLCHNSYNKFNMQKTFGIIGELVPFLAREDVKQLVIPQSPPASW